MENQVNDTGSGESLVYWEEKYLATILFWNKENSRCDIELLYFDIFKILIVCSFFL